MTVKTESQRLFRYQNLTAFLSTEPTEVGVFINSARRECPVMFIPERAEFMCSTSKKCLYEVTGHLMIITSSTTLHKVEVTIKYDPDTPIALNEFLTLEPVSTYSINLNKLRDRTALLLYKFISDNWDKSKRYAEVTL